MAIKFKVYLCAHYFKANKQSEKWNPTYTKSTTTKPTRWA